jgi:predicted amidohydrolase YtcJ
VTLTARIAPVLALLSFQGRPATAAPDAGAVTLVSGGRIYLNDAKGTVAEALLVRDGRVVRAGTLAGLEADPAAEGAARIDLQGGTALPGLQDAEGHLEAYGEALELLDLSDCADEDALVARVAERAAGLQRGEWIRGRGWDVHRWPDAELPQHAALSKAVPANPVFLLSADGHAALVNHRALELAGIDGRLDPPPRLQGGRIVRDAERYATGVLLDAAQDLVLKLVPRPTVEDRTRRILAAQDRLLALGLTCVHDMGVSSEALDVLRTLRDRGDLRLRVVAYLSGNDRLSADMLEGLPESDQQDRLSIPGVTLVLDGALDTHGAAMLEDYADAPGERGYTLLTKEDLARRVAMVVGARLQPSVAAVGNRANRMVLDVYQELGAFIDGFRLLRPRVEHTQIVAPRDWPRFPALGVVPAVQPIQSVAARGWLVDRLGTERARDAYAWRRLAPELGRLVLAFGSDFPYASPDPRLGLHAARARDADAAAESGVLPYAELDAAAVLAGFTSGAAYACHQEEHRGRLAPGYAADLTVFDRDPLTCAPEDLLQAQVLLTVIDGRVVFRAGP